MQKLRSCDGDEYSLFYLENDKDNNLLKLLSIFDLISYEIEGGNTPEIYIYLNAPDKIKRIVEDRIPYRNNYVIRAAEKHYRAVKILDYFFRNLHTDEERWDFIEKYFLGEDVESDIIDQDDVSQLNTTNKKFIENYINENKKINLSEYESWEDITENLFNEDSNDNERRGKYKYFCNLLRKSKKIIPDYAHTELEIGTKNNIIRVQTLFIYLEDNIIILPETYKEIEKKKCIENGWKVIIIDELDEKLNLIKGE